jgi:hypothetical protein
LRGLVNHGKNRKGQILSDGKYRNLIYIEIYLRWLAIRLTELATGMIDERSRNDINAMAEAIEAKRPRRVRRAILNAPMGLSHEDEEQLLGLVNERALRETVLAAQLLDRCAGGHLLQEADDLFAGKTLLHVRPRRCDGLYLDQFGPKTWGQVSALGA